MRVKIWLLAIFVLLLSACTNTGDQNAHTEPVYTAVPSASLSAAPQTEYMGYRKITAEQAKARMEANEDAIVLDVRTKSEYEEKHIPGAILIPNETIIDKQPESLPDLNAEILIYCRTGNRSRQASEKFIAMGYTNVYDFGGIVDWPYETESGN